MIVCMQMKLKKARFELVERLVAGYMMVYSLFVAKVFRFVSDSKGNRVTSQCPHPASHNAKESLNIKNSSMQFTHIIVQSPFW